MFKNLTKERLFIVLVGLFVGALLISNVLAGKLILIGGEVVTAGIIVFPLVYILNDVFAEVYGFQKAKRVIVLAFVVNLTAVIFYNLAMLIPSPVFFTEGEAAFRFVLGTTFRVLIASFAAYLIGTLMNSYTMAKMKQARTDKDKGLFIRAMVSTLVGETVDSLIFITIVFAFVLPWNVIIIMILVQIGLKVLYEFLLFPVTNIIIRNIKALKD